MQPGIRTLSSGSFASRQTAHSLAVSLVAPVRDSIPAGLALEEGCARIFSSAYVVVVRTFVVAPTDVHAHLLGRNFATARIQVPRPDTSARRRNSSSVNSWKPCVPRHRKVGAIELEHEACR